MYTDPVDDDFIYDEDVMDAEHFMDSNKDMYMEIEDVTNCCMKQTVKKYIKLLINKRLTNIEVLLICLYQFVITMIVCMGIIQFHIVARCLTWMFQCLLEDDSIMLIALFINIIIIIQFIGEIYTLIIAFLCKCDYITLKEY